MEKKELKTKVFEAIGEASMCWSSEPLGIFDSNDAKRIGDDLLNYVQKYSEQQNQELLIRVSELEAELSKLKWDCGTALTDMMKSKATIEQFQSDKQELIEGIKFSIEFIEAVECMYEKDSDLGNAINKLKLLIK